MSAGDDDKYRVKNPTMAIVHSLELSASWAYGKKLPVVCTALPHDAGIFLFPATKPSKSSQQQIT